MTNLQKLINLGFSDAAAAALNSKGVTAEEIQKEDDEEYVLNFYSQD